MENRIHPLADCQSPNVGEDTRVWQFCVVLPGARIGHHCNICAHVLIENDVVIGNHVTVKSGVQLWDGIRIEDHAYIGPNATFTNDLAPRSQNANWKLMPITVRHGASIGANATVVCNVEIGPFALVGAGSVVTHDVPAHALVYGNPARQYGFVTRSGILLDMECRDEQGVKHNLDE